MPLSEPRRREDIFDWVAAHVDQASVQVNMKTCACTSRYGLMRQSGSSGNVFRFEIFAAARKRSFICGVIAGMPRDRPRRTTTVGNDLSLVPESFPVGVLLIQVPSCQYPPACKCARTDGQYDATYRCLFRRRGLATRRACRRGGSGSTSFTTGLPARQTTKLRLAVSLVTSRSMPDCALDRLT